MSNMSDLSGVPVFMRPGWQFLRSCDVRSMIVPAALLIIWQVSADLGYIDPLFLPSPASIFQALYEVALSGELWIHIATSVWRIGLGFGFAAVVAIPLGLALGYSATLRAYLTGLLELLRPVPPIALIPVSILWLGIDDASKVAIIAYACFWPILLNVILGVEEIPPLLRRAALAIGLTGPAYFTKVMFPAALPKIIVGLRISAGIGFVVVVAAELVAASSGLGFMILDAERTFRSSLMFGGIVILSVLGLIINNVLVAIENRVTRKRR